MNWTQLLTAIKDTLLMSSVSIIFAYLIGFPLGILLNITSKRGIKRSRWLNLLLGSIVNIFRSIPCLLLIIILIPVTNLFFGTGSWSGYWYSMIVPLVVSSFAFIARLVEQSMFEVNSGIIEASKSLGASNFQIIKVLISEAKPSLISGFCVSFVSIISYTSFAGYIAAGGLISEAFNLGYYGTNKLGMWICIIIVVVIVQVFQELGLLISSKIDKRRISK